MEYAPSSLAFVVHRLSVSDLPQKPSRLGSKARVTIIDVRDEERGYDGHIVGFHHYANDTYAERMPKLA
jgi:rhodanese-related sulfurtransferase